MPRRLQQNTTWEVVVQIKKATISFRSPFRTRRTRNPVPLPSLVLLLKGTRTSSSSSKMAEDVLIERIDLGLTDPPSQQTRLGRPNILYSLLASVAIGGLLLGLMGLTFLASIATLLLSSPVLLVFSPVIFPAGFVIATSVAGIGAAAGMALVGVAALACICRSLRGIVEEITESGKRTGEFAGQRSGRIARQKVHASPPEADAEAEDVPKTWPPLKLNRELNHACMCRHFVTSNARKKTLHPVLGGCMVCGLKFTSIVMGKGVKQWVLHGGKKFSDMTTFLPPFVSSSDHLLRGH
ncbi:hypothetical protein ACLOJK_041593 [Asimina triloba]